MTEKAVLTEILERFRADVGRDPRARLDDLESWLLGRIAQADRAERQPKTGRAGRK